MTREGAVEVNAATGKKKRISKRIRDADFAKTEAPQPPEQAAQPLPGGATSPPLTDTPPLPHAPGAEREQDTAAAERVLERIDGARTRKASKKAARKAQAEATAKEKSSRLQFTDEERATPELERYIRKSDKAADRLDAAKAEKAAFKANVDFQYHKALHDNPQIAGNPLSRFMQKQQIKRQYAKSARKGGAKTAQKAAENTRKAAKKTAEETKKAIAFVGRHPAGVCIAVAALLLFIMVSAGLSSCGSCSPA